MYNYAVIALHDGAKTERFYEEVQHFIPIDLRADYPYVKGGITHIPLKERDSEEFQYVWTKAKENGIKIYHYYELNKYTSKEIREAEYFEMGISNPLQSEGKFSEDYGTKYENCCPVCKIGGTPVGDVLVDRKFVKKCTIATLIPDIFVSKKVKWIIETNGFTGVKFDHMVKDYKGRDIPEYYSMRIDNTLNPADKKTWFTTDPPARTCPVCGIVVPYLHSAFWYRKEDITGLNDFNLTYEFVNNWSLRSIIVSRNVKDVFNKAKIRAGFTMINVV